MPNKNYFKIVHKGFQKKLQREQIQIQAGNNCNIFLIKTDEGFIVDVYGQNDTELIDTMAIFEDDLNPNNDDDINVQEETGAPENFSDIEVAEFKNKWGQSHSEVCNELGYNKKTSDDLLMLDFFWINADKKWYNKESSLFTPREQAIANYLKYKE